jgi:hypothetical protein
MVGAERHAVEYLLNAHCLFSTVSLGSLFAVFAVAERWEAP